MDREPGGRSRRRLPDLSQTPATTVWTPPDDQAPDPPFTIHLEHGWSVVCRMSKFRGAPSDFALTLRDQDGRIVARADCDHGCVHVHPTGGQLRHTLVEIRCQGDVARGYDQAYDRMMTYHAQRAGRE